ncbi:MAG TPA: MFS transporter [Gaiellaceae bacterium]|jgi:MFS family permease|nr:MFS transporter [Gaiellaceae bacterium]
MEAVTAPSGRLRILDALRHRDFRLLWSGQAVSLLGDMAFLTALAWRTFTLAGSSRLGVVLLCNGGAMLATLLVGGVLADRYERRRMMIFSDVWRFGAVGALAAVDAMGHLSFPILVGLAVLVGLGDGFFYPAVGGIVPLVVEQPALASANSLLGVARWGSVMVGPSLAALTYHSGGPSVVFAFNAGTFLVSAALISLARPRPIETATREGTLREIREGARYVARIPWLWVTIALFSVVLTLQYASQQVLLPKLVHQHFHRGVGAYGLLVTFLGVGTVLGTLAFGQLQPRRRRGVVAYAVWLVNSLAIVGVALSPWFGLAAGFAALRGACLAFGVAIWETMLQELVPERLLARVVSLDFFGTFGLTPIGLAIWAAIADIAPPGALIASGAGVSCVLIALVLTRPWLWEVD